VVEASAGSGKTYALAKRYVQLLLNPSLNKEQIPIRQILAITFTNKAAFEMKSRILEFLKALAFGKFTAQQEAEIITPIGLTSAEASARAFAVMEIIIRHYNFFQVQTIDKFINALLSGCAFKIDLTANFKIKTNADAAEAVVEADKAAVENAKVQLSYCYIYSPIDGRVGSLLIDEGNLVRVNDGAALVVINQINPIHVTFAVPESNLADLKRHMTRGTLQLDVNFPSDEGRPERGRIRRNPCLIAHAGGAGHGRHTALRTRGNRHHRRRETGDVQRFVLGDVLGSRHRLQGRTLLAARGRRSGLLQSQAGRLVRGDRNHRLLLY